MNIGARAAATKRLKQTVSLTINSDVVAHAKRLGINASQIAESALAAEIKRVEAERIADEVRQDLRVTNAYAEKHGSFAEMVREHYQNDDD